MNKVMRYQIIKPVTPDVDWKLFGEIIHSIQDEVRFTKNKTISLYNDWTNFSIEEKKKTGSYPKLEDVHSYKTFAGYAYDVIKNNIVFSNTSNYTSYIRNACSAYDTHKVDIIKGLCAVPNANKNQPIDLHNKSIQIKYDESNGNYSCVISLLSNRGKKDFGVSKGQVEVALKVGDNTSKIILDRCLSGEYKVSGSQIIRVKNKLFLNLCYGFDEKKNQNNSLNKEKIMGIDLGVAIPVYMAFNFDSHKRFSIKDNRIMTTKWLMDKKLSYAKAQCNFVGSGNSGHGRTKKVGCYESYGNKSKHLSQTINHTWSKLVIEQAVKNGCGTIQMEDLTGVTADKNKFLKNWTFYDLQQKIIYKAKEQGIDVVKVNPKYTSQRCSKCGCICKANRPEQKTFKCVSCGFETNADFNAARNISTKDISAIIAHTTITEVETLDTENKENTKKDT